jgi:hypothetical protein
LYTSTNVYTFGVLYQPGTTTYNLRFFNQFDFLTSLGKKRGVELSSLQTIVSLLLPTKVSITLFTSEDTHIQNIVDVFADLDGKLLIFMRNGIYPDVLAEFCLHIINRPPDLFVLLNALGPKLRKLKCDPKLLVNAAMLPLELDYYDVESNVTFGKLNFNC